MLHNPGYSALPRPRAPRCVAILALFSSFPSLFLSAPLFRHPFARVLLSSGHSITHSSHFLLFLLLLFILTLSWPFSPLFGAITQVTVPFSLYPLLKVRLEVDFLTLPVPVQ